METPDITYDDALESKIKNLNDFKERRKTRPEKLSTLDIELQQKKEMELWLPSLSDLNDLGALTHEKLLPPLPLRLKEKNDFVREHFHDFDKIDQVERNLVEVLEWYLYDDVCITTEADVVARIQQFLQRNGTDFKYKSPDEDLISESINHAIELLQSHGYQIIRPQE